MRFFSRSASLFILCGVLLYSCSSVRHQVRRGYRSLSSAEKKMADSLLATALDHEALYSLMDTLKPISSIRMLSFPIARDSADAAASYAIALHQPSLDTLAMYQHICRRLSTGAIQFVLVPFQQPYKGNRQIEIYAVNRERFRSRTKTFATFFGQFGITPDTDPVQAISILEYESKYDRWRGYGYWFGYPDYAVDFFVEAGRTQDNSSVFVARDFFQIPVYASTTGYFTYAMPKGYSPSATDSVLYKKAAGTLYHYRQIRPKYSNNTGLKAVRLWSKHYKK